MPPQHTTVYATGGDASATFGTVTDLSGTVEPIHRISFATAVATALLIR